MSVFALVLSPNHDVNLEYVYQKSSPPLIQYGGGHVGKRGIPIVLPCHGGIVAALLRPSVFAVYSKV